MSVFKAIKEFFSSDRIIILVIFIVLMVALSSYSNSKTYVMDKFESGEAAAPSPVYSPEPPAPMVNTPGTYGLQEVANPSELLPIDSNKEWSSLNPTSMNGAMPDLLTAGYHIGLDTIGQTLKNANLQLRSEPIIPKVDIGPWNQSTIESDYARTPFEIGPYSN
jgi:hypothetical protein